MVETVDAVVILVIILRLPGPLYAVNANEPATEYEYIK